LILSDAAKRDFVDEFDKITSMHANSRQNEQYFLYSAYVDFVLKYNISNDNRLILEWDFPLDCPCT